MAALMKSIFLMSVISVYPVSPSVYLSLSVCTHIKKTQDVYPPLTETPLDEYPKCQSSVLFPLACDILIIECRLKTLGNIEN